MELLANTFKKNLTLKTRFETQNRNITRAIAARKVMAQQLRIEGTTAYIPVVFHVVLQNPGLVTDAQIQAQVDQLNLDFGGVNPDSTKIRAFFKPRFAKTNIQFRLAQRTPGNEPSNGIERITTSHASFGLNDSRVKYAATGGADAWDNSRFFNVWITDLSQGYLGYSTFPGSSVPAEDGIVIRYTSLPGGVAPYNKGRTLVHETGHFFYLFHTWGDDVGCSGNDEIDDTPNQANYTSGCPGDPVRLDACTTSGNGIMYENFMDYTDDACMVMYTLDQKDRMEAAMNTYRASLLTSNGADPVIAFNLDAAAKSITTPLQRLCSATFSPVITLRNRGAQTLTTVTIQATIDNGTVTTTTWTGSLASLQETSVTLNSMTVPAEGTHILNVVVSQPNGSTDENTSNDVITQTFQYYLPLSPPLTQSFENAAFPPAGWDVVNADNRITWERVTGVGKTGNAAVVMRNFDYQFSGQRDLLRLPVMNIANVDSAYITFQVAAAVRTDPKTSGNEWDTLQVLASKDCGATFTSIYKKWGSELITRSEATSTAFTPAASEWRKDSVNLTSYIGAGEILLAFANTSKQENNIYLDDINVYSLTIDPVVKAKGFVISPNPTRGRINIQFYPNAALVKGINIFTGTGQRVSSLKVNAPGSHIYSFDMSRYASGVYIVQVVLGDRVITQKVIKR
ncbi:hypothetical protein A4R26_27605 [Niastella populi]|uniref:Peptidase M43 pregnancy-associated plasma-A domain-containing protein n=2 Tax=Niastella populi TaxID=550983 RepID=A0A1V9F805_9BACT|nr:hypothetical protein A4R26_27605 [Niastella populi]